MKKLLTTLTLLSSFSLACDLPFEEISGVKIGCPMASQDILKKTEYGYLIKAVPFFDLGTVFSVENDIADIIFFQKTYTMNIDNVDVTRKTIMNDLKRLIITLEERWGKFSPANSSPNDLYKDVSKIGLYEVNTISEITDTSSDIVKAIAINISSKPSGYKGDWDAMIRLAYYSKKAVDKKIDDKRKELEGF